MAMLRFRTVADWPKTAFAKHGVAREVVLRVTLGVVDAGLDFQE